MNKRVLIFLLAIIIAVFTYAGYRNVVVTDLEIGNEVHATYDLAHELSIAYVWYDITIGDIMAVYSAGAMDKDTMIGRIEIGKKECHKHLITYAKGAKTYESNEMAIIYAQDSVIDGAINDIIKGGNDTTGDNMTALYKATRPVLETINYIIITKSRYIECLNENIQKDNEHIRGYLINSFTLSLVLFMASLMKLTNLDTPHTIPKEVVHRQSKKPVIANI